MIGLNRHLAPMSERAWGQVEDEAREMLKLHLAARRLMDFEGPLGWEYSAIDLGRIQRLEGTTSATAMVRRRVVRPLIELRVSFELAREQLERIDRGAGSVDLDPLRDACLEFAAAEDAALLEGYADGDVPGLLTDAETEGVALPADASRLPEVVSRALDQLRRGGVAGPYAIALGPEMYAGLDETAGDGGYPVLRHVQSLVDHSIVWAPTLRGGAVVSLRGGDFKFVCGRDATIGYSSHDDECVRLYLEESFNAVLDGPEAVVPLLMSDT